MVKSSPSESTEIVAYIDGASRGNPGRAAYGVVLRTGEGVRLAQLKKVLGVATNNAAEYEALLAALEYALRHGHQRLKVKSDSELLARQLQGKYKVKSPDLKALYERAGEMIARLEAFSVEHVRREQNREADRLANLALDAEESESSPQAAPGIALEPQPRILRARATFRKGRLEPRLNLPLAEGEDVELEIRRKL